MSTKQTSQTEIDLAEDLLTGTTDTLAQNKKSLDPKSNDPEDLLESARILCNEGLWEDAKQVLRRILIKDPSQKLARVRLQEIHERELKQLFLSEEEATQQRTQGQGRSGGTHEINEIIPQTYEEVSEILSRLELDLGLEVSQDYEKQAEYCFGSREQMIQYQRRLEVELVGISPRDRLDLGIAFLEMGLSEVALGHFRVASRSQELELFSTTLIAHTLLTMNKPYDAIVAMEPLLTSAELEPQYKIHLFYLTALAQERLGKKESAQVRLKQVVELDPDYRDAARRLKNLK